MERLGKAFLPLLVLALAATPLTAQGIELDQYLVTLRGHLDAAEAAELVAGAGGELARFHSAIGLAVARSDDPAFAARAAADSRVAECARDRLVAFAPEAPTATLAADPQALAPAALSLPPQNALFFPCQWNLRQIDAPGAWNAGHLGSEAVRIFVLDTGIDPFHVDLAGKVDPVLSTSVLTSSPCGAADTGTYYDLDFHGTFVAALAASNNLGMAGVAPRATLVAVKVLNCQGSGTFADLIAGLLYAADNGADVVNLSLGATFDRSTPGAGPLLGALARAVSHAHARGAVVPAAAGGGGLDLDHAGELTVVPAESGTALGIYATTIEGELAASANHGVSATWVGAPGGSFPNPFPGSAPPLPGCPLDPALQSLVLSACSSFVCGNTTSYLLAAGTSFATATASGVAALVDGTAGGGLDGARIGTRLARTADDLGEPGVDNLYSHGRVNARRAVEE